MNALDRERVASAVRMATTSDPVDIASGSREIIEACGTHRVGAERIVAIVGEFAALLTESTDELDGGRWIGAATVPLDELAAELRHRLDETPDAGPRGGAGDEETCQLGPALLALATHFVGRAPHYRPDALGSSSVTAEAAAEVLGWASSGNAAERLVAALTAPDRALVDPLLHDPDPLVRTAAGTNRCLGSDGLHPARTIVVPDPGEPVPARGLAALSLLQQEFSASGLTLPGIAERFARAGHLSAYGPWRYASTTLPDPFADYVFLGPARSLQGPVQQQLAISHAGHGVNSHALNLRLAVGPVAIMAQIGWGGVHGGADDGDLWSTLCEGVDIVTHGITLSDHGRLERRRWLVLYSPLRMGYLPTLYRYDGDGWVQTDEESLHDPHWSLVEGEAAAVLSRWVLIHDLIEQDLLVHERSWSWQGSDGGELGEHDITVPDPTTIGDRDDLSAVVGIDGRVIRLEYSGGEEPLVRRGGVWLRAEEAPDRLLRGDILDREDRIPVLPEAIGILDAAELIGLRLAVELLPQPER